MSTPSRVDHGLRSARRAHARALAPGLALLLAASCDSTPRLPEHSAERAAAQKPAPPPALLTAHHSGPPVVPGESGPQRFVPALLERFDPERAMETVRFADGFYRTPANPGYDAVLDHVAAKLREAGYGAHDGFELFEITTPLSAPGASGRGPAQAWSAIAGKLSLERDGQAPRVLHAFASESDRDRTLLPVHACEADVTGPIATSLDELEPGEVLAVEAAPTDALVSRARARGAVALLSSNLESYNVDPTGGERQLDAIQYRSVASGCELPVAMVSPRSMQAIRAARADRSARLHLEAHVRLEPRELRTLCARVVGKDRPREAVVTVSHVQEPGACDNASGVGGLCESACVLARSIEDGTLPRPARSLVFLWGDEFRQSSAWLDHTDLVPVAALSSDMTGESRARTGAIALYERMPDPGALVPLPPDEHTPWGKAEVDPASLAPNGVALVARCALLDTATREASAGGPEWVTAEHPYEGGSDHDVFIARGVPAGLFWHFTDFAYHTNLDRLELVDPLEIRRTGVALLSTALALADPEPADLDRYLRSLDREESLRVEAAERASQPELAQRWRTWCRGAREWLRVECLHIPHEAPPEGPHARPTEEHR